MSRDLTFAETKRNINRQGTKILHDIVCAYETGLFDHPQSSHMFTQLLACICEGKVEGFFDDDGGVVKWSLTKSYSEQLEKFQEALMATAHESENVVKGPW